MASPLSASEKAAAESNSSNDLQGAEEAKQFASGLTLDSHRDDRDSVALPSASAASPAKACTVQVYPRTAQAYPLPAVGCMDDLGTLRP